MDVGYVIPVFCIATMFAIGLDTTFEEAFVAPFRNLLALAIVILVNNVFVPLLPVVLVYISLGFILVSHYYINTFFNCAIFSINYYVRIFRVFVRTTDAGEFFYLSCSSFFV